MGAGQSKPSAQPPAAVASINASTSSAATASTSATAIEGPSTNGNTTTTASTASPPKDSTSEGGCPMKNADGSYRKMPGFTSLFGRMAGHPPVDVSKINIVSGTTDTTSATANESQTTKSNASANTSSGCPVKQDTSKSWNILRRGGSDQTDTSSACPVKNTSSTESACPVKNTPVKNTGSSSSQQYDVYSRPLPMDPTNNMPLTNPTTVARNSLPAPGQHAPLPTERVASSIPKGGGNDSSNTWTYPSPQMFYNALARKGKLDSETKEEDMISVVAIHNCMNEGTWGRVLQWENVLNAPKDGSAVEGPSLTKFMGRPTDLSPKAFFKHYFLNHPLPFDRHDWTVTRTDSNGTETDVRYVIDYYHDDAAANDEEGSGLPDMNEGIGEGGKLQSLVVDVRPAADSISEVWGRMIEMPLARRGCRSVLECVLFKGHGSGKKSQFEPLPLRPSESLEESLGESQQVWENIQNDAANKKGVGAKDEACASDNLEGNGTVDETAVTSAAAIGKQSMENATVPKEEQITKDEATSVAQTFSKILTTCQEHKATLQSCSTEEECQKAYMGMTVCAGKYMCPLQHGSLVNSLTSHTGAKNEEMAEAKINTALDVLGECVANYDGRASMAKKQFPEVFDDVVLKGKKK